MESLEELEERLAALQEEVDELQERRREQAATVGPLQEEKERLEAELESLRAMASERETTDSDLAPEVCQARADLSAMRSKIEGERKLTATLAGSKEELEREYSALVKQLEEVVSVQSVQKQQLEDKIAELHEKMVDEGDKRARLIQDKNFLVQEIRALQQVVDQEQTAASKFEQELMDDMNNLQKKALAVMKQQLMA